MHHLVFANKRIMFSDVLFLFTLLILQSCSKKTEKLKPELSNITESVYASGVVKATDQYTIYPQVNGILQEIKIKPGDSVKKGQILFVVDNNTADFNTQNAKLSLDLSENFGGKSSGKLQEAELKTKLAYDQYQLDSSMYVRQKRLWEQGIGSLQEFDQRHLAFISSKHNYEIAKREYKQLHLSLRNDLKKARVNYAMNKKTEDNFKVRSAIDGRIFDISTEKGDLVSPQTALAVLGRKDNFIIELQVDENDIARILLGQKVEITMDSYQGQIFEGKVQKIYPIMDEHNRTFKVNAAFIHRPPRMFPNLTAEASIIIRRKRNTLVIPRRFVDQNNYVWISKDQKRKVKTGLRDYKKIEILSGLDTSEMIYMPPK